MNQDSTKDPARAGEGSLFDNWIDAIEDGVRSRVRDFIETMLEEELSQALARPRYGRQRVGEAGDGPAVSGVRNGHRERSLTGTFGKTRIAVPRARLTSEDGGAREWRSTSLRAYHAFHPRVKPEGRLLRQVRLTTSLPTGPANTAASARRTRRVLVPDR